MNIPEKFDEKKHQAECDLHTMIEYQKICNDKGRYKAAMAMRKKKMEMLEEIGEEKKEGM